MKILKYVAETKFRNTFQRSLLALIVFGFFVTAISNLQLREGFDSDLEKNSKIVINNIQGDLDEISTQILFLSSGIRSSVYSRGRIFRLLNSFAIEKSITGDSLLNWNTYSWINKNDKMSVDGKFGIIKNKPDLSKRDYIRFTKFNPEKIILGDPVFGVLTQRLIIPIALGVFNKKSKYLGTLVYGYDVEKIIKRINNKIDADLYSFIVFKSNKILFSSEGISQDYSSYIANKIKLISLSDNKISQKISSQGLIFGSQPNSYYIKPENSQIGVVIAINKFQFFKLMLEDIVGSLMIILTIAILFFFLFRILYQRLIAPISYLSEYAQNIAKKNFDIKIQKPYNKELHEIFDSLDEICSKFKKEESAKKQLVEINKKITTENLAKNYFFEAVCRDVREPLFAILKEIKNSDDNIKKDTKSKIVSHSNEASQIIDNLLDITQTSSGALFNFGKKTNINQEIDKSIKIVSSTAKQKKISIKFTKEENLEEISVDHRMLKQIFVNLMIKVIAITKSGTRISINCEELTIDSNKKLKVIVNTTLSTGFSSNVEFIDKENHNSVNQNFEDSKELIKKMNGNIVTEQKSNDNFRILITFSC